LKVLDKFPNIHVISQSQEFSDKDVIRFFIPYQKNEDDFIRILKVLSRQAKFYSSKTNKKKILFLHQEIDGAKYGNYVFENRINKALFSNFDWVFSGHIHQYQELTDRIIYCGSLQQLNFGECNNTNYFLVYDSEADNYEKIEIVAPRFVVVKHSCIMTKDNIFKDNFAKIIIPSDVNRNEIRKRLYDNGCLGVVFEEERTEQKKIKLKMKSEDNYISVFEKYIDGQNLSNKNMLKKLGIQILKKVSREETSSCNITN
jgi:DNA repair exonuclease SbcCD nuclease subunit